MKMEINRVFGFDSNYESHNPRILWRAPGEHLEIPNSEHLVSAKNNPVFLQQRRLMISMGNSTSKSRFVKWDSETIEFNFGYVNLSSVCPG
jgi:hypothetical protein